MKEGWKKFRLGDICTIERGGSPRPIDAFITNDEDGLNWIKIGDASEGSKYITHTAQKIKKEGLKKTRFVHCGDFILSNSMSFGRPYILKIDGCIHDGWLVLHDDKDSFDKEFLYYYLSSPTLKLQFKKMAVGGVVNNLNSEMVRNLSVAVPPMAEQKEIVEELNILNNVIALKKEQISELEMLANATFHEMFGDLVTNEKGWPLKKIEDCCDAMTKGPFGSDMKKSLYVPKSDDTYKVYIQVNAIQQNAELGDYYISKEYYDEKMYRFEVHPNDYIITCDGTLGRCYRLPENIERGVISSSLLLVTLNDIIEPTFFEYIWSDVVLESLLHQVRNAALQHLPSAKVIGGMQIPFPSKDKQKDFAIRIEQIKHQKQLIQASIEQTQTLLDATMEKYFG